MARLSAYAPAKAKDFIKLEKILLRDDRQQTAKSDWRDVFAKVRAWGSKQG